MSLRINTALLLTPIALGATLTVATDAIAQSLENSTATQDLLQQVDAYGSQGQSEFSQIQGAAQFGDVTPNSWAYQALDDLTRHYDCLKGYPNGLFRGNRALSRYEFAAGLNACLQQMERLVAETTAGFVTQEDIALLQRLMQDFERELSVLSNRVDGLENRLGFLEDNQFSTTTKFDGEVVWTLGAPFGGNDTVLQNDEATFDYRVRLAFDTSFNGKDRLRTRIEGGNGDANGLFGGGGGVNTANGALNLYTTGGSTAGFGQVWYRAPINDDVQANVVAVGALLDEIFDMSAAGYAYDNVPIGTAYNTNFYDVGRVNGGAAVAFNIDITDDIGLDIGYFANESDESNQGIFSGNYGIPVQLNVDLGDQLDLALGYMHSYGSETDVDGGFGTAGTIISQTLYGGPTVGNHYMLGLAYDFNADIQFSGFVNYLNAVSVSGSTTGFEAEVWSWAANLAFPDLMQEGDVLSVGFGQLPSALKREGLTADSTAAYMANIEYRFKVNDHIELTPAFFAIFNPEGNSANDTIYAGVLRTVFSF